MMILQNVRLKMYNTFGLDYGADRMIQIETEEEAVSLFSGTISLEKPLLILGGGSNILFTGDYKGTIILPEIKEIRIEADDKTGHVIVSAGAGVDWDEFVDWTVKRGFGGLENLSLIPGKVGATPVQNIGAYGVEVKDFIVEVRAVDISAGKIRIFSNDECQFAYRNSVFKNTEKGKYLITRVSFRLALRAELNLSYGSLKDEVARLGPESLDNVRQAVINIRSSKLPDPEITGNAGSFFKNPVVPVLTASSIMKDFPKMPFYIEQEGFVKLAAGWLIEQCGWKGIRKGDAGVHDKQALVLINYGNASGQEIYDLSSEIRKSVHEKFGVELEREVEIA